MKVLITGETSSPHLANWVSQLRGTGWELVVFQSTILGGPPCPELAGVAIYSPFRLRVQNEDSGDYTLPRIPGLIQLAVRSAAVRRGLQGFHNRRLADLIRSFAPDVVHSLALNVNWVNVCSPVLDVHRELGGLFEAPWVYSSWGTDLDYYATLSPSHRVEAQAVLGDCDYYIAECERDSRLAKELGFRGEFLGCLPAFGGVDNGRLRELRSPGATSARRTIFLKGRDNTDGGDPVGRALTALRAFRLCEDLLVGYRVVVGTPSPAVAQEAAALSSHGGLDIQVLERLPYDELLRLVGASRVFMALTVNDGLPSSLVEAMGLGAFPIYSDLEPIAEWITTGRNGLLVPPGDPVAVAEALRRALTDDSMVDDAACENEQIVEQRLSTLAVRPKVLRMYEHVVAQGRASRQTRVGVTPTVDRCRANGRTPGRRC